MKLSYSNITGDGERHEIAAEITTDHSQSSYGQPVIILDGDPNNLLDGASWILLDYRVVSASEDELAMLRRWVGQVMLASGLTTMSASEMGKKGGAATSLKKAEASRENGKKGGWPKGRPRKPKPD